MNQNSNLDLFILNFSSDFVPKEIEDKYRIVLDMYKKPYPTILDYVNSAIKDVSLSGLSYTPVSQKKLYGKEINYRASVSPYDVYQRELNINIKNVDFGIMWRIYMDLFLYHYIKNGKPYVGDIYLTTLDEERRELFVDKYSQVLFTNMSEMRYGYQEKNADVQTFSITLKYNYLDIEFKPKYVEGSIGGDLIENYSDIIMNGSGIPVKPIDNEDFPDNIIGH